MAHAKESIKIISKRIQHLKQLIHQAAMTCHRSDRDITLLGVSKGQSSDDIAKAYAAGVIDFGESYLQEALPKIEALSSQPIIWHFIGPIQSNKAAGIAEHFSWVHSVSREKIARQLNRARPTSMPPLNVCVQVNLDQESTKAGVDKETLTGLVSLILQLPQLRLRGLMLIPKQTLDESLQTLSFLRLSSLLHDLNQQLNIDMDTLSMGMSHDFEAAIFAGSTMVRIGTGLFGVRQ